MKYKDLEEKFLRDKGLIKVTTLHPCYICKSNTHYIDYCSEQRICSEECKNKLNEMLLKAE